MGTSEGKGGLVACFVLWNICITVLQNIPSWPITLFRVLVLNKCEIKISSCTAFTSATLKLLLNKHQILTQCNQTINMVKIFQGFLNLELSFSS